jgi:hypothetical protein
MTCFLPRLDYRSVFFVQNQETLFVCLQMGYSHVLYDSKRIVDGEIKIEPWDLG